MIGVLKSISKVKLDFGTGSKQDFVENLQILSRVFKQSLPAWDSCEAIQAKVAVDERYAKLRSMVEIFAKPSKYKLFEIATYAFHNWSEVNQRAKSGLLMLENGQCVKAGKVFGGMLREIVDSDQQLLNKVVGQVQRIMEGASDYIHKLGKKTKKIASDILDNVKNFVNWDEL